MLDNLELFLRITEKGGMAAAGRDLGLSPTTVSERIAALEAHYGARLLTRTTRSISLTDEGRAMVEGARRILAEVQEMDSRIRLGMERISGSIRISAPVDLGRNRIARLLDAFMRRHPEIRIDLTLDDGYADLAARGFDLGIRFGDLADSTMRTRKLGDTRRLVCASPAYLDTHGVPHHPEDLQNHNCILMRFGHGVDRDWRFLVDGKEKVYPVSGDRIVNDGALVREWCRAGHGIALKSNLDVDEDLEAGRLVQILEPFTSTRTNLQVVYPAGAVQPRRIRLMIDHLVEEFSDPG